MRVKVTLEESELPKVAVLMGRHELSTGATVELTLPEWDELFAWLSLGEKCSRQKQIPCNGNDR